MYLCLAALSIGIFASCKAKKGVEATFSDLDGSWNIVELNGKVLNPAETNQVIEFDVARHSLSGRAGCNLCQNARSGEENEKERACYCDGRKGGSFLQRRPLTIPKCTF